MSYKDSLTLFEELCSSGVSAEQASIQAHQLGSVTDLLRKIEKDLIWMRIIGGAMIGAFLISAWFK